MTSSEDQIMPKILCELDMTKQKIAVKWQFYNMSMDTFCGIRNMILKRIGNYYFVIYCCFFKSLKKKKKKL